VSARSGWNSSGRGNRNRNRTGTPATSNYLWILVRISEYHLFGFGFGFARCLAIGRRIQEADWIRAGALAVAMLPKLVANASATDDANTCSALCVATAQLRLHSLTVVCGLILGFISFFYSQPRANFSATAGYGSRCGNGSGHSSFVRISAELRCSLCGYGCTFFQFVVA